MTPRMSCRLGAALVWIWLLGIAPTSGPGVALHAQDVAAVGTATDFGTAIQEARDIIEGMMEEQNLPGFSVAVGIDGEIVWSEGFGFANLEHQVRVTPLTKFRIGSVSKPITAAAMGILMREEKLDLDAPIQQYVPSFPAKQYPITVRQVAGHIAGIRHYQGGENFSAVRYPTVLTGLDIFDDDPLLFEPGTDYSYSTYGWNLLSAVVEGASHEKFLGYMNDRVFQALNMRHTVAGHTDSIIPHRTNFYVRAQGGMLVNAPFVDNSYKWAGGGFLSTPEDLIHFGSAHLQPGFLDAETLQTFFTSQRLSDGEDTGYGIGWGTRENDLGEHVVSHGGGSVGGTTILTVNLDRGLVVAAASNISGARMGTAFAAQIEALFLNH